MNERQVRELLKAKEDATKFVIMVEVNKKELQ